MLILIKGAGDIASGIAVRLRRCGFDIVMTELEQPTAIRRSVCFSEAIINGRQTIEGISAKRAELDTATDAIRRGFIAVLADEKAVCRAELSPEVVIDAILAKRNTGTSLLDAPVVIGVGPGFTAGRDCHAVVETNRGHDLGRVIYEGSAAENTGIPGNIGGYTIERVLRSPVNGEFFAKFLIGDSVEAGETIATVSGEAMKSTISGIIRGLLPNGTQVTSGMKCGDVDPRCVLAHCYSVSDKARAVAGGALEAVMKLCYDGGYRWKR